MWYSIRQKEPLEPSESCSLHEDCCDRFVAVVTSIDIRDAVAAMPVITESVYSWLLGRLLVSVFLR